MRMKILFMGLLFAHAVPAQQLSFEQIAAQCAPDVHPTTLKGVVTTESSWNPYAIGVVGGRLARQPENIQEAVATARDLEKKGYNFSLGLGQVNRHNLSAHGETYETIFDICRNLKTSAAILKSCYQRAQKKFGTDQDALKAAFSCYYSGNFSRGFVPDKPGKPTYVQKVVANAGVPIQSGEVLLPPIPSRSQSINLPVHTAPVKKEANWISFSESKMEPTSTPVKVRIVPPEKPASIKQQVSSDLPFVQIIN